MCTAAWGGSCCWQIQHVSVPTSYPSTYDASWYQTTLSTQALNMHSGLGWLALLANLANAPAMALCLLWIVQRAKKCLDFAATLYLLHLSACCAYGGFPRSLGWWGANVAGFVVTALAGEWLCLRREMQDIPTGATGFALRYLYLPFVVYPAVCCVCAMRLHYIETPCGCFT